VETAAIEGLPAELEGCPVSADPMWIASACKKGLVGGDYYGEEAGAYVGADDGAYFAEDDFVGLG
jgi:hypothetical protein